MDGFIENYKAIENAKLQILETQQYEMQVQSLIRRGERMEESNWQLASYLRAWEQDVDEYYTLVTYFNSRVQQLKDTPSVNWNEDKYQWSPQPYLSQILQLRDRFSQDTQDYDQIRAPIERLIEQAERDKDEVYRNLRQTTLSEGQNRAGLLEQQFEEFNDRAYDVLDECYQIAERKNQPEPKQTADNHKQNSGDIPVPSGQKQSNTYYHGYWIAKGGGERLNLIQEGHGVNYNDRLTGKISGNSAVFTETNSFGEQRTFELLLLNDGYKIKRKINYTDNDIKDILKRYKNISNPTEEQIRQFRESDKNYHFKEFSYGGSSAVAFGGDEDHDGVADKFDKCPNTPAGYTLLNGGVNTRGCSDGMGQEKASASEETSSTDTGTSSDYHSTNPGADTESTLQDSFRNSGETNREETQQPRDYQQANQNNLVGEVWTDCNGNGGYLSIPLEEMHDNDQFIFKLISGEMEYVQVISRNKHGSWVTLYKGPRTSFAPENFS
ncbi:MAG: hypothetical protein U5L09_17295 [Bacteroidales bacterium]|nr:hypothetical protein [Bacteroidales bacterium]